VRGAFMEQAGWCRVLGSPFTARICVAALDVLDHSTETGHRILDWAGNPEASSDALALRLAGGLHALKRAHTNSVLAQTYPPNDPSDDELRQAL
jgi:hypothetical protein